MAEVLLQPAPVLERPPEPLRPAPATHPHVHHRRADLILVALLAACDAVMLTLAMLVAFGIRSHSDVPLLRAWDAPAATVGAPARDGAPLPFHPLDVYIGALGFVIPLWLLVASQRALYTPRRSVSQLTETVETWKATSLTVLIAMAAAYLTKYDYSRTVTVLFWLFALVFTSAARYVVRSAHLRYLRKGHGTIRTLIYGTGEAAMMVVKKMQRYPELGYQVVGLVDDDPALHGKELQGTTVLGSREDLVRLVQDHGAHEVFIAQPFLHHERILEVITSLDIAGIRYRIVSDLLEALTSRIELDGIANIPIVDLKGRELTWVEATAKSAVDYLLTLLLLIPALPLMAVIAILIKLDSKGSVMFRQERVGRRGRLFRIFKFRTMHDGCEKFEPAPESREDPRITRVGRLLRRTSLDELPQMFNVLLGDMSLVGPRPEMPFLVHEYKPWQLRRLDVKPGITGLWQILGRKDLPLHGNLEYDFYYIQNRSLLWDLVILVKTIPVVLFGKGAY